MGPSPGPSVLCSRDNAWLSWVTRPRAAAATRGRSRMECSPVCVHRELVVAPWARVGEAGPISPRTEASAQRALGQRKGCENIKAAILVTRPFYLEKMPLSALNEPLELQGAVPVSPHLLGTGLVDFLSFRRVPRVGARPAAGTVTWLWRWRQLGEHLAPSSSFSGSS